MALLKYPAPEIAALWGSDRVEHVTSPEGSVFQAYLRAGQVHYEQPITMLPGCLTDGVHPCFNL